MLRRGISRCFNTTSSSLNAGVAHCGYIVHSANNGHEYQQHRHHHQLESVILPLLMPSCITVCRHKHSSSRVNPVQPTYQRHVMMNAVSRLLSLLQQQTEQLVNGNAVDSENVMQALESAERLMIENCFSRLELPESSGAEKDETTTTTTAAHSSFQDAKRLIQTVVWMIVDRAVSLPEGVQMDRMKQAKWIKQQLLNALTVAVNLGNSPDTETEQEVDSWAELIYDVVHSLHNYPLDSSDSTRAPRLLFEWVDLTLFRTFDGVIDSRLFSLLREMKPAIERSNMRPNIGGISLLCQDTMLAILHHNSHSYSIIASLFARMFMRYHTIPPSQHMLDEFIITCRGVDARPRKKWYILQQSNSRYGITVSTFTLTRLLFECQLMGEMITADSVIQFIKEKRLPINGTLAHFILICEISIRSAESALNLWDTLDTLARTSVKWDGSALSAALSAAILAQNKQFARRVVKELLHQSDSKYSGAWPSPFFATVSQRARFISESKAIAEMLHDQNEDKPDDLAERWLQFCKRHDKQFGGKAKMSKRQQERRKARLKRSQNVNRE